MLTIREYKKAESLEEAYTLNQKKSNRVIGGMIWLKMETLNVGTAIDLSGLGLDTIEETETEFRIGAMASLRALELHEGLAAYTNGAMRESVRHIVGVQLRNLATVGGSLYSRFGFSDVLTMFLVLDAQVELYKGGIVPLSEYAERPKDRDILVRVIVPKRKAKFNYQSVRISQTDIPVLTCASVKDENGYRFAIGARPGRAMLFAPAGDTAEQMAKSWGISREQQDALAHRSHQLAAKAWEEGKLSAEVMTAYAPPFREPLEQDNNIRKNSTLADYQKLRPAFDRKHGTVTAANSTPLTDGAAAVILMTESRAKELGLRPLGYLRSYAFTAIDVWQDMLLGPAWSTPLALERACLTLADLTLIDMHEAFAAQTLANLQCLASDRFAREVLGRSQATGEVDESKFNVLGGSIAYGHPFAATGARMITQTLHELRRRGGGFGLVTACAAGGLGAAMIVEAE